MAGQESDLAVGRAENETANDCWAENQDTVAANHVHSDQRL